MQLVELFTLHLAAYSDFEYNLPSGEKDTAQKAAI